jgi:hypothetical protein
LFELCNVRECISRAVSQLTKSPTSSTQKPHSLQHAALDENGRSAARTERRLTQ